MLAMVRVHALGSWSGGKGAYCAAIDIEFSNFLMLRFLNFGMFRECTDYVLG